MRNLVSSIFIILIVVLGIAIFMFFGDKKETEEKFSIDYENLETIAQSHPVGERFLSQIREKETFLYDNDDSNDFSAYLSIAFAMHQLGYYNGAVSTYKKALKIDPEHTLALNNLAVSYREIKEYKKAEGAYRNLLEVSPGDVPAYRNLADVYRLQYPDDEDGLVEIIEQGLARVLKPADLLSYLASYYRDRGNIEKAIDYFEQFLRLVPGNNAAEEELKRLRAK